MLLYPFECIINIETRKGKPERRKNMKTLKVIFESGKEVKYHGALIELIAYKARIKENEERRKRLNMSLDKAIKFEITECIY